MVSTNIYVDRKQTKRITLHHLPQQLTEVYCCVTDMTQIIRGWLAGKFTAILISDSWQSIRLYLFLKKYSNVIIYFSFLVHTSLLFYFPQLSQYSPFYIYIRILQYLAYTVIVYTMT